MNVKELIDKIPTTTAEFIGGYNGNKCLEFILKSDFDRVVEELTKWNKVEDGLPRLESGSNQFSEIVLIKDDRCGYCISYYNYELKKWSLRYGGDFVTHWRYIY